MTSIFEYLTPAERRSVTARDLQMDISAGWQDAVQDNALGMLRLEDGYYRGNFEIPETMQIQGTGMGFSKGSPYKWKCALFNQTSGTPAIKIAPGVYHQGVRLSDFAIVGHGSCSATPNGNTDDGILFSGEAQHIFERLQIWGCGGYGLRAYGVTDKTIISRCKVSLCGNGGVRLVRDTPDDAFNHISISQCEIDANFGNGIDLFANNGTTIFDNTIQGNAGRGISIVPSAVANQVLEGANISMNYFESNMLGGIYGLTYAVSRIAHAYGVNITQNRFIQPNGAPDIKLLALDGSASYHTWRGCRMRDNLHSGKHTWVDLGNGHGYSTVLELPQYVMLPFADLFKGLGADPANSVMLLCKP